MQKVPTSIEGLFWPRSDQMWPIRVLGVFWVVRSHPSHHMRGAPLSLSPPDRTRGRTAPLPGRSPFSLVALPPTMGPRRSPPIAWSKVRIRYFVTARVCTLCSPRRTGHRLGASPGRIASAEYMVEADNFEYMERGTATYYLTK